MSILRIPRRRRRVRPVLRGAGRSAVVRRGAARNRYLQMNITADTVKQLRERTGAGMMECKKALVETKGDLDAAAELMRKTGLAKADKKAARVAAEGTVAVERAGLSAVLVEVNCETDFVARSDEFLDFARGVGQAALEGAPSDLNALLAHRQGASPLEERRRA